MRYRWYRLHAKIKIPSCVELLAEFRIHMLESTLYEPIVAYMKGLCNGPLTRYAKLRITYAPGIPATFSPPPRGSDPDMHHGTCVTHVPWCMSGSLTSGFFWSRWRGKRSRHSRRMRNKQFYVSGKWPLHGIHITMPKYLIQTDIILTYG